MTEVPPHTALTVLMPSMETPLVSYWPPRAWICGPFSVWKMPAAPLPVPPGPWLPGLLLVPPPGTLRAVSKHARRELGQLENVAVVRRQMLNLMLLTVPLSEAVAVSSPGARSPLTVSVWVVSPT